MEYKGELARAMSMLAEDNSVIFLGQSISYSGNAIYGTMEQIPSSRKIELPVFEDVQLGISIGLSLGGCLPVSIFPRMDFLIIATNQLVNHLDKIEDMSLGQFKPKVIIRTSIGSVSPLNPGAQHCQDHTEALRCLLKNIDVVKLTSVRDILPSYRRAYESERSTVLIEMIDLY